MASSIANSSLTLENSRLENLMGFLDILIHIDLSCEENK